MRREKASKQESPRRSGLLCAKQTQGEHEAETVNKGRERRQLARSSATLAHATLRRRVLATFAVIQLFAKRRLQRDKRDDRLLLFHQLEDKDQTHGPRRAIHLSESSLFPHGPSSADRHPLFLSCRDALDCIAAARAAPLRSIGASLSSCAHGVTAVLLF